MKLQVTFDIECAATTCASEPGKFCEHLGTIHFGCTPVCMLFKPTDQRMRRGEDTLVLKEQDGWAMRCDQCLERAK